MNYSVQSPLLGRDIRKLIFAAGLAGTTSTLTAGGTQPPKTKKILAEALGPKTRATLQAAMDSMGE